MVMDGAMDFQICFAFVWFVVLQVICGSLIFCYNSIMRWCFVLLFFIVKNVGDFCVGFDGCIMGHWNNFMEDWFPKEI
jgi:hypothetical protein